MIRDMKSKYGYRNGVFINLETGTAPTLTEQHDSDTAHKAVVRADDAFQTALVKRYKGRAGDMRYRTAQLPQDIRDLALAYQASVEAWRATFAQGVN